MSKANEETIPVERMVMCRASTILLAGKMLRQLAEYGSPEVAKPMNETASEILQAVSEQCSIEEIDVCISAAQSREGI